MKDFDLKLPENLDAAIGELPAEYTREGAQVLAGGQDIDKFDPVGLHREIDENGGLDAS